MANIPDARVRRFLEALDQVTGMEVVDCKEEVVSDNAGQVRLDFLVHVRLGDIGRDTVLGIEAKDTVYPRDAKKLVDTFAACAKYFAEADEVPVVVSTYLSDGAQKLLRDEGVNFFEVASGTLYYRHGLRHIDIRRESNEPAEERRIRSVFNGAREQVVHALLEHWRIEGDDAWLSGADLANLAETSPFTVSTTMKELERQSWVDMRGSGPTLRRRLSHPSLLLDAWADVWRQRLPREKRTRWYAYASGRGGIVDHMLERLANRDGWALTGAGAANAMAPHLTAVDRASIIVPPGVSKEWAAAMALEPAEKGANVTFVERTGASMMFGDTHPERPGSHLASRFVMYLDLLDGVGRNKELAAEFRSKALKLGEKIHG